MIIYLNFSKNLHEISAKNPFPNSEKNDLINNCILELSVALVVQWIALLTSDLEEPGSNPG
jgi:hypothetical protein